jgi:hypothetical protein
MFDFDLIKHKSTMDGVNVYISRKSEVYVSIRGVSRLCNVDAGTIYKYLASREMELKMDRVLGSNGVKNVLLLNDAQIIECLAEYNEILLKEVAKIGIWDYLYRLSGV